MAPSPLSLLVASCAIISVSVSGQDFVGPGYLDCSILDFELVFACVDFDQNCTTAQFQVCNSTAILNATTDADFQTVYFPLQCDCVIASGCPDSCEFFTGDLPTLPPITGFVNYTGVGNVTCPIADIYRSVTEDSDCTPTILDLEQCGTCTTNGTFDDPNFGLELGDADVTYPLVCECISVINCPNTCTFVATDGDKGNVTAPISAPIRSPVAAPSSTSFATVTTSHKVCAVTAVLTMMFVSAF